MRCSPAWAARAGPDAQFRVLLGLPIGDHEVAVLALDRAQELETEETGGAVDRVCAGMEPLPPVREPAPSGILIALIFTTAMPNTLLPRTGSG